MIFTWERWIPSGAVAHKRHNQVILMPLEWIICLRVGFFTGYFEYNIFE